MRRIYLFAVVVNLWWLIIIIILIIINSIIIDNIMTSAIILYVFSLVIGNGSVLEQIASSTFTLLPFYFANILHIESSELSSDFLASLLVRVYQGPGAWKLKRVNGQDNDAAAVFLWLINLTNK